MRLKNNLEVNMFLLKHFRLLIYEEGGRRNYLRYFNAQ